jgi:3-deoxy-manno-octulosonate cytidylyltransferase (CMP-KDO synthetase)
LKTIVIIPSRYASIRLPAKPLAMIRGQTLIERVYQRARLAEGIDAIYVATDHAGIAAEVERFGGSVIMTSPDCPSGTDRVAQAAQQLALEDAIIINVQGDEPLIEPDVISALASAMKNDAGIRVATPIARLCKPEELNNPSVVKVVLNSKNDALYFSRQWIPYARDIEEMSLYGWLNTHPCFKHIGVYAYRAEALKRFVELGESPLERAEKLEQLRLLEAGIPIRCVEVEYESIAVDTPEDIVRVEQMIVEKGLA